ncbi:UNVERIFIED_CONTAM: hypothetical protein Scaly_1208900 [Sesamum calycinum]|uniref:VQ domain-containing protein n=1 Tax=Sesamum calycinum TaxID=2727403 RepID=A0AAW2Q4B7_9LAMI
MGKKSSQPSKKQTVPKQEKKQHINSLIKILRPKVYITDSSNFKRLVQELPERERELSVSSPPDNYYPSNYAASPPSDRVLFINVQDHAYQDNSLDLSFDSSCFSTPLDGSPDLQVQDSCNYVMENSILPDYNQTFDFSSYKDLESLLLMDNDHPVSYNYNDASCGMFQQEVCVFMI